MKAVLFLTSEVSGLSLDLYVRVQIEAERRGIPLICYCGSSFHDSNGNITAESKIYEYINKNLICGVIANGGAIGQFSSNKYLNRFVKNLSPIPVISLSFPIEDATSILVDNYQGIYNLIDHLIKDHTYDNIGFVKGPDGHPEAEERLKAYKDALKDNGISVNENLIASGDFSEEAGKAAVKKFLSTPNSKIQAIACVDDDSALGVYKELKDRGLKIPGDIAVSGFDDIESAQNLIPSLTTVAQPYNRMIEEAFNQLERGNGEDKTIPTAGIFRESCGCRDKDILAADIRSTEITSFSETKEIILGKIINISDMWRKKLLSTLERDLENDDGVEFIDELGILIEETGDLQIIHTMLSYLSAYTPHNDRSRIIFQQARLLVNKISNRLCSLEMLSFTESTIRVNELVSEITQVESYDELKDLLSDTLPDFDTKKCYIVLYKDSMETASIFFKMIEGKQLNKSSRIFDPKSLLPDSELKIENNSNLLVVPLIANGNNIGYAVYEINYHNTGFYNTINTQISGELSRLNLQKQREDEKRLLEERNKSIQSLIEPMLKSIKDVTEDSQNEIKEMIEIKKIVGESNTNLNRTIDLLNEISLKINSVMESVSTINDISENVNVLAINTSIQSAHAGEFGKAFGVIAKEIRKLSDSTAINAKTITEDLSDTIKEFKSFTEINRSNVETFKNFTTQINHFMDVFNNIANQMESLSSSSLNIIDIMER